MHCACRLVLVPYRFRWFLTRFSVLIYTARYKQHVPIRPDTGMRNAHYRAVCTGPTGYDTRTACYREVPWVSPHGNEATPHLTTRERGYASSYRTGMRRRLVSPRENEAPPCLPAGGRGDASSFDKWMSHRLVFQLANEAPPRLPAGTRRHEVSTAI
ncbi:hypothetical protein BHM03_00046470 [Ensete ventricosum]|nr:hypothetical protein BHM03_00046470 [Ensete ventricosum]